MYHKTGNLSSVKDHHRAGPSSISLKWDGARCWTLIMLKIHKKTANLHIPCKSNSQYYWLFRKGTCSNSFITTYIEKEERADPLNMLNLIRYAFPPNPTLEFYPKVKMETLETGSYWQPSLFYLKFRTNSFRLVQLARHASTSLLSRTGNLQVNCFPLKTSNVERFVSRISQQSKCSCIRVFPEKRPGTDNNG